MPCPATQVKAVGTLGAVTWVPNTPDEGNLEGTCRTLDNISGATLLKPGLISRAGWVVVDDSATPLLDAKAGETRGATHLRGGGGSAAAATGSSDDASPWDTEPWPVARPAPTVVRDWYFFGHGASTGVGGVRHGDAVAHPARVCWGIDLALWGVCRVMDVVLWYRLSLCYGAVLSVLPGSQVVPVLDRFDGPKLGN